MILGLLTSCGAGEKSSTPVAAAPPSSAGPILRPPRRPRRPRRGSRHAQAVRTDSGAARTARAWGYGAPEDKGVEAVTILSSGTVPLEPDGYFPLTLTCNLPVPCTGGILACISAPELTNMTTECGRTEEYVDPGATRTLGTLPTPALGVLHATGPTNISVTVDNRGVPQCEEIPQLAAQCAAAPPDHNGLKTEGLVRLIHADVTVTPPTSGWGSQSPDDEAASHQQLQQLAAETRRWPLSLRIAGSSN